MSQLYLTRPFALIDLETTGINVGTDRIVEIAILKIASDNKTEIKTHRVNPGIPIPAEVSKVHGIYDKDVKDAPVFSHIAKDLANFLAHCDLGGYNSNKFDIPLLVEEFLRAEVDFDVKGRKFVDVQNIFHKMEQRNLAAAFKFYCGKELENAHSAENDINATYQVLLAQIDKYKELKNDVGFLHDFSSVSDNVDLAGRIVKNTKGEEIFNFGKHKGKLVQEVFKTEPSYYEWMMNGDFPLYTKKIITAIRLRAFNKV